MGAKLGLGLVGCGRFGHTLAETVQGMEAAHLVAVQNRTLSKAVALAASLGIPAYSTHEELIADPNVEAILVANAHSLHEEVVIAAARAGKHIFCEKPLAIDVASCYRMIEATERRDVKMMCGHVMRLYPAYKRVAEIVKGGRLGQVSAVQATNLVHIDRSGWWARSETMGALLHSPGVHFVDLLLSLFGPATSVQATASRVRVQRELDYDDSVFLLLQFQSGAIGAIASSVSCLTPRTEVLVVGTEGSLAVDRDQGRIDVALWNGERERIDVTPTGDRYARSALAVRAELDSFVAWVTLGTAPILTAWDGLHAVEIVDAAYRSIACGHPVALPLPREA